MGDQQKNTQEPDVNQLRKEMCIRDRVGTRSADYNICNCIFGTSGSDKTACNEVL